MIPAWYLIFALVLAALAIVFTGWRAYRVGYRLGCIRGRADKADEVYRHEMAGWLRRQDMIGGPSDELRPRYEEVRRELEIDDGD